MNKALNQWQEHEKEQFIELIKKFGKDWEKVALQLPNRTAKQCRNYFQNYKHTRDLQKYVRETEEDRGVPVPHVTLNSSTNNML
mmetsp:Transcript_599/g.1148  ORF Transcript_599/g.1148 Transcript_599/m.1148 type:complete len:84 (-) Transcript_599:2-253(-)